MIIINSDIFINKKEWLQFSDNELREYEEKVFSFYRKQGFPYYPTDSYYRRKNYLLLNNFNLNNIFKDNSFYQSMHGLNLAWSYFPHSWEVKCNNLKTPMEVFTNDDDFRKVIHKRMVMGDNMSHSGIRKMLKIFSGTQCVSNFRPTTAGSIYNMFADEGVVWDMSAGFGGRLLGFLKSNAKHYIGTEPSSKTFHGLNQLQSDYFSRYADLIDSNLFYEPLKKSVQLIQSGSELFLPDKASLDFCFTSPPYFNCELYSNEITQSSIKFPIKDLWIDGYLRKTFENCHYGLKSNKYMAINIANTKSFVDLEEETIKIAKETGFKLEQTYYYLLSSLSKKEKYKSEPIFIFKKY